jgi:hypothetical protein
MKRAPSMPDRDVLVPKHPTPSPGVPAFEIPEEVTGQYEGEELARIRASRPTDKRMAHVEKRIDETRADLKTLARDVHAIAVSLGEMRGEVRTALGHVALVHKTQATTEQVRIGTRGKVIVGVTGAVFAAIGVALAALAKGCA